MTKVLIIAYGTSPLVAVEFKGHEKSDDIVDAYAFQNDIEPERLGFWMVELIASPLR